MNHPSTASCLVQCVSPRWPKIPGSKNTQRHLPRNNPSCQSYRIWQTCTCQFPLHRSMHCKEWQLNLHQTRHHLIVSEYHAGSDIARGYRSLWLEIVGSESVVYSICVKCTGVPAICHIVVVCKCGLNNPSCCCRGFFLSDGRGESPNWCGSYHLSAVEMLVCFYSQQFERLWL